MYLTEIESTDIRCLFTKLRIDMNCIGTVKTVASGIKI